MDQGQIYKKIKEDLLRALKSGNIENLRVLRLLSSALHNKEIEKRRTSNLQPKEEELSHEEAIQVLKKEIKQRLKAIELYERGKRPELAEREKGEIEIIKHYLPETSDEASI